jgi:hypothetical protein
MPVDITILTYSRLSHIIASFHISTSEDNKHFLFSRSDPSAQILSPGASKTVSQCQRLLTLSTLRSSYQSPNEEVEREGIGHLYEQKGARFFGLLAMFNDFSIDQYMGCLAPSTISIEAPQPVESKARRRNISTAMVGQSDFIIEDGEQEISWDYKPVSRTVAPPTEPQIPHQGKHTKIKRSDSWTKPGEETEFVASQLMSNEQGEAEDLGDALISLQGRLESNEISSGDTLSTL